MSRNKQRKFVSILCLVVGGIITYATLSESFPSRFSYSSVALGVDSVQVLASQTKRNYLYMAVDGNQWAWCVTGASGTSAQANAGFKVTSSGFWMDVTYDRRAVFCRANTAGAPLIIIEGLQDSQ